MVIMKIFRALQGAAEKPNSGANDRRSRTLYHWRCQCGAHSRGDGGWLFESDAEYNAQRHQWRSSAEHSPEVYTTIEEVSP